MMPGNSRRAERFGYRPTGASARPSAR